VYACAIVQDPIAQLQEPYSSIRYLAENCAMIENLKIVHPSVEDLKHEQFYKDKTFEWTPADICEGGSDIVS